MIDAHVHLFPDEAGGREWQEVVGFPVDRPATADDLGPRLDAAGIDRAVVLLFPRSAHRASLARAADPDADDETIRRRIVEDLRAHNAWGCALAASDPRYLAFIGADASFLTAHELVAEIRAGAANGARGVKILPGAMRMYPDDERLAPVFATCVALGLPVLSQSRSGGKNAPGARGPFGAPAGFRPVLAAHPALRLILAHLGRGLEDELLALAGAHPRQVWSDTSLRFGSVHDAYEPAALLDLIRRLGPERVLFGTNYPMADPVVYRERFDALGLTADERAAVGEDNARALLRL